jgi:hypothetical protein
VPEEEIDGDDVGVLKDDDDGEQGENDREPEFHGPPEGRSTGRLRPIMIHSGRGVNRFREREMMRVHHRGAPGTEGKMEASDI